MSTYIRIKLLFWCAVFFIGTINPVNGQDTLTVISYNIYHGENPETAESTLKEIAGFINDIQPDFVALQEVDDRTNRLAKINSDRYFSLTDSLAQLTGMVGNFEKAIVFNDGDYGLAILSHQSFESGKINLPNPDEGEPRILMYIEAETSTGTKFIIANTHLDHRHPKNRIAQTKKVNDELHRRDMPVILAGDFNSTPDSKSYDSMKPRWMDATHGFGKGDPTYPTKNPIKRIDYIFLSRDEWKVLDFRTYRVPYSDHLPIVARVVINKR